MISKKDALLLQEVFRQAFQGTTKVDERVGIMKIDTALSEAWSLGLISHDMVSLLTDYKEKYTYGLSARPFGSDSSLMSLWKEKYIEPEDVSTSYKRKYGKKVHYGVLITPERLTEEFIKAHELKPLYPTATKHSLQWGRIKSAIIKLINTDDEEKYLSSSFLDTISLSLSEYTSYLNELGYMDAMDAYLELEDELHEGRARC